MTILSRNLAVNKIDMVLKCRDYNLKLQLQVERSRCSQMQQKLMSVSRNENKYNGIWRSLTHDIIHSYKSNLKLAVMIDFTSFDVMQLMSEVSCCCQFYNWKSAGDLISTWLEMLVS